MGKKEIWQQPSKDAQIFGTLESYSITTEVANGETLS